MRVSTFFGSFLHKKKIFINVLGKRGNVIKLFSIICVRPSPKFSSTEKASLEVDRGKLCLASISSYLFKSGSFIMNCVIEEKAALFVIQALWESVN